MNGSPSFVFLGDVAYERIRHGDEARAAPLVALNLLLGSLCHYLMQLHAPDDTVCMDERRERGIEHLFVWPSNQAQCAWWQDFGEALHGSRVRITSRR